MQVPLTIWTLAQTEAVGEDLSRGDTKSAIVHGLFGLIPVAGTILNVAVREGEKNDFEKTVQNQQQTIQELQGRNQPR